MTNEVFRDKRLLGALDYIDERFIAEVTESYTFEAPGEYKRDKKTVFRAYRQFTALAACLILISATFPVLYYAVQRIGTGTWEGIAGAGTSELEMTTPTENEFLETEPEMAQTLETEPTTTEAEILDSGFDKYLEAFENMSADEIYAEVLKGGWAVVRDKKSKDVVSLDLWLDFLKKVEKGKASSVLIAYYSENRVLQPTAVNDNQDVGSCQLVLVEVKYDGKVFVKSTMWYQPQFGYYSSEYAYLLAEKAKTEDRIIYFLANSPNDRISQNTDGIYLDNILAEGLISVWNN